MRWAQQGVLLLNTVLTVRQGQPNSHKHKGWEPVTDAILRAVIDDDDDDDTTRRGCVFLVWGIPATKKVQAVLDEAARKKKNSSRSSSSRNAKVTSNIVVIATSHPSPLGATKTKAPFLGSRCFSRCNEALAAMGHTPIDWNVDSS